MKALIIPALLFLTIIFGGMFEQIKLHNDFEEFSEKLTELETKILDEKATCEDAQSILDWWSAVKSNMHIYVPHTELKDIDLWLEESKSYIGSENFDLAHAKLRVLQNITQALPKTFEISFGNIF